MTSHDDTVRGVLDLLGRYVAATDHRDSDTWVRLFGDDGVLLFGDREISGAETLSEFVLTAPRGVHLTGVPAVVVDGDEATSTASFLYHNSESGGLVSGYYHDRIDVSSQPYHFIERRIDIIGRNA